MCLYVSLSHTSVSSAEEAGRSMLVRKRSTEPPNALGQALPTRKGKPGGVRHSGCPGTVGRPEDSLTAWEGCEKSLKYGVGLQCFSLAHVACPPLSKPSHRRNWHRYLHTHVHRGVIHNKDGSNAGVHQWMKKSIKCSIDTSLFSQP